MSGYLGPGKSGVICVHALKAAVLKGGPKFVDDSLAVLNKVCSGGLHQQTKHKEDSNENGPHVSP